MKRLSRYLCAVLPWCTVFVVLPGCFHGEQPLPPHEALARASERIDAIIKEDLVYPGEPVAAESAQTPDDPREVHFWFYAHPILSPLLLGGPQGLASFASAHPGTSLSPQFIGDWSVAIQKYTVSIASDDLPDMGVVKRSWLARLIPSGRIVPLDTILPAEFLKDICGAARESLSVDGHLYAFPADGFCDILYYNRTLVGEAPPETWAGLRQCAEKIRQVIKPEEYPIGHMPFLEALWSAGGDVCTLLASNLDGPEAHEALEFVVSLKRDKLAHPQCMMDPALGVELFLRGKAVMTVASSEYLPRMKKASFPVGIVPVPGKSKPLSSLSDNAIVVFARYAEAKKAAIANVADFLTRATGAGEGSAAIRESLHKVGEPPELDRAFELARNAPLIPCWGAVEFELNRYLDLAFRWEPQGE